MHTTRRPRFAPAPAIVLLLEAVLATSLSAAPANIPLGNLAATQSGNDLVLWFPTASPALYTVQTCPDLQQPWTNLQSATKGDGTVQMVTVTNGLSGDQRFCRLLIQYPERLLMSQTAAFAILGHSCGGIREQVYVTGFEPTNGYPIGNVYLSTTCSTGGRGSTPHTFTAWAAVTWDFAGNTVSSTTLSNAATVNTNFLAIDAFGDTIYNIGPAAYLVVPTPAAPLEVGAFQDGDQFQVSWTLNGVNPAAVTSSILTATPLNSAAPVLITTVSGSATNGVIPTLQPQTTYQITVVNTTISGFSPFSAPVSVTTEPASIPPSAPAGVAAHWMVLDPTGTNDTLVATWLPAIPGDSPLDQYQVTIVGSEGAGTFSQTVSGTTLTAFFSIDFIPNWSVTVRAHNAFGWGPASSPITLGGL